MMDIPVLLVNVLLWVTVILPIMILGIERVRTRSKKRMRDIVFVLLLGVFCIGALLHLQLRSTSTKKPSVAARPVSNTTGITTASPGGKVLRILPERKVPGKTIWILWLQGWEEAPWIAQQVRASWEIQNPTWNVELVSAHNLSQYVRIEYLHDGMTEAAKSDCIRLHLMAEHGGVWADATLPCLQPLDDWVYDAVEPSGLWMYRGWEYDKPDGTLGHGCASWFMVSLRGNPLMRRWRDACIEYWKDRSEADDYFWMDNLFRQLLQEDEEFSRIWECVPALSCEDEGQAHMLAGRVLSSDPHIQSLLRMRPPYVVKLSRHGFDHTMPFFSETNASVALEVALHPPSTPYPLHTMVQERTPDPPFKSDRVLVVPDCNQFASIHELRAMCRSHNFELVVYDCCNFCKHIPESIYARPLRNVGRDMGVIIRFVVTYYDILPSVMMFLPSTLDKHDRRERGHELMANLQGECGPFGYMDFQLDDYEHAPLVPADPRPIGEWVHTHVGEWEDIVSSEHTACWNGLAVTTREAVWQRPKELFQRVLETLIVDNAPETTHYVERILGGILGVSFAMQQLHGESGERTNDEAEDTDTVEGV